MNPRKLNIFIIVLYATAVLCMLGAGSIRQQLKEAKAIRQAEEVQMPDASGEELQDIAMRTSSPAIEALEEKLTFWQIVTLFVFAAASLLLIFKDKLTKATPPRAG